MKRKLIQSGTINLQAFECDGATYSAHRVGDLKSLSIEKYDKNFYSEWNLSNYLTSDFQPEVLYLFFDLTSKLDSFVIKMGIYNRDELLSEITVDKSNSQNAGKVAIYSFKNLVLDKESTIRFGANEDIERVTLRGRVAYAGNSFSADKSLPNTDTYDPLPDPNAPASPYTSGETIALGVVQENYDYGLTQPFLLFPFTVLGSLAIDSLGCSYAWASGASSVTTQVACYNSNESGQPYQLITTVETITANGTGSFFTPVAGNFSPNVQYWAGVKFNSISNYNLIGSFESVNYSGTAYAFDNASQRQLRYNGTLFDTTIDTAQLVYSNLKPIQVFATVA